MNDDGAAGAAGLGDSWSSILSSHDWLVARARSWRGASTARGS
jgi:hypothetical protein